MEVHRSELVARIARQKKGKNVAFDGGERTEGFEVADAAAVAEGLNAGNAGDGVVGNENVAEFAAETIFSFDDVAVENNAAAVAGADDDGDRSIVRVGAEDGVVSPESGGVGVVEIGDGLAEFASEAIANIEAGPIGVDKVGGAAGAELAGSAGGAGSVEAEGDDIVELDADIFGGDEEAVGDLLEAYVGALLGEGGMFAEAFDEEFAGLIYESVVDGGAAQVNASDDGHDEGSLKRIRVAGRESTVDR